MDVIPQHLVIRQVILAEIINIVSKLSGSQQELAKQLNLTQPRFSRLMNGHVEDFSLDGLVKIIDGLGMQVSVSVSNKAK